MVSWNFETAWKKKFYVQSSTIFTLFCSTTPIDASRPPFLIIFIKTFVICTFNEPILFFLHVLYNVISLNINNSNTPKNKRKFTHSPSSNTMGKPLRREVILSKNLILPTTTFFQYGNTSKKKQAFSVWDFQKFRLTPIWKGGFGISSLPENIGSGHPLVGAWSGNWWSRSSTSTRGCGGILFWNLTILHLTLHFLDGRECFLHILLLWGGMPGRNGICSSIL